MPAVVNLIISFFYSNRFQEWTSPKSCGKRFKTSWNNTGSLHRADELLCLSSCRNQRWPIYQTVFSLVLGENKSIHSQEVDQNWCGKEAGTSRSRRHAPNQSLMSEDAVDRKHAEIMSRWLSLTRNGIWLRLIWHAFFKKRPKRNDAPKTRDRLCGWGKKSRVKTLTVIFICRWQTG